MVAAELHDFSANGRIGQGLRKATVKVGRAGTADTQPHSVFAGLGANTHKTVFVIADVEVANEQFKTSKGHTGSPFVGATQRPCTFTDSLLNKVFPS